MATSAGWISPASPPAAQLPPPLARGAPPGSWSGARHPARRPAGCRPAGSPTDTTAADGCLLLAFPSVGRTEPRWGAFAPQPPPCPGSPFPGGASHRPRPRPALPCARRGGPLVPREGRAVPRCDCTGRGRVRSPGRPRGCPWSKGSVAGALPACAGGDAVPGPGDGDVSGPPRGTSLLAGAPHSPKRASTRSSQPAACWPPVGRGGEKPSINGLF